ncbi:MAG: single-stranded DNA-binding protein [Bacteroidales bacterium]
MSVNKVILVGNVGKDPETRYLDEGTAMCKFPMATSETYKNRDGDRVTNTEWHNVVLWRGLAQIAEKYVKKGTQLYIEGKIRTRSYDDSDGNRKYITEIVGEQMTLLGRRPDDGGDAGPSSSGAGGERSAAPQPAGQNRPSSQTPAAPRAPMNPSSSPGDDDPFQGAEDGPDDLPF